MAREHETSRTSRRSVLLGAGAALGIGATVFDSGAASADGFPDSTFWQPKTTTYVPVFTDVAGAGVVSSYAAGATVVALGGRWSRKTAGNESVFTRSAWNYLGPDTSPGFFVPNGWGRNFATKLAAAPAGALAKVALVADSVGQGYYASSLATKSYSALLRAHLTALAGNGGSGYSGMQWSQLFMQAGNPNNPAYLYYKGLGAPMWGQTGSGAWSTPTLPFGPSCGVIVGPGPGNALQVPASGTTIQIYYLDWGTNWSYQVDGGTPVPVTVGTTKAIKAITVGVSAGSHTITVNSLAANGPYFIGARGSAAHGVLFDDYSMAGASSGMWANDDDYRSGTYAGGVTQPADLVIYELGGNDIFNAVRTTSGLTVTQGSNAVTTSNQLSHLDVGCLLSTDVTQPQVFPPGTTITAADPWAGTLTTSAKALAAATGSQAFLLTRPDVADRWVRNVERYLTGVLDGAFGGSPAGDTDVLLLWPMVAPSNDPTGTIQQMLARARGLAESYGAAFVNAGARWRHSFSAYEAADLAGTAGSPGTQTGGTDPVHPSDKGHAYLDQLITPLITAAL